MRAEPTVQESKIPLRQPPLKLQGCARESDGTTTVIFSLMYLCSKIWKFYLQPPQLCRGFFLKFKLGQRLGKKPFSTSFLWEHRRGSCNHHLFTVTHVWIKTEGRKKIWAEFHLGWGSLKLLEDILIQDQNRKSAILVLVFGKLV